MPSSLRWIAAHFAFATLTCQRAAPFDFRPPSPSSSGSPSTAAGNTSSPSPFVFETYFDEATLTDPQFWPKTVIQSVFLPLRQDPTTGRYPEFDALRGRLVRAPILRGFNDARAPDPTRERNSSPLALIAISALRTPVAAAFIHPYHPCRGPSVRSVGSMVQAWARPPLLCGSVARSAPAWQPSEAANTMGLCCVAHPSGLKSAREEDHETGGTIGGVGIEGESGETLPQPPEQSDGKRRRNHSLKIGQSTWKGITYLGEGSEAIVRLGCVLVAPPRENSHFLRRASILVYAMGETHDEGEGCNSEYVVRGLLLDNPTAFTMADVMSGMSNDGSRANPLAGLTIFRGGDTGRDGLILLQHRGEVTAPDAPKDLDSGDRDSLASRSTTTSSIEIAKGLYHGGWDEVMRAAAACSQPSYRAGAMDDGSVAAAASSDPTTFDVSRFKVLFNYLEFTELQLEKLLAGNNDEGSQDDCWISLEVPPNIIVGSEHANSGAELWSILRNAVAQMRSSPS